MHYIICLIWIRLAALKAESDSSAGLLDYDKNHNHDYFGQYCNHDYLKQLFVGHMTKTLYERFI